MDHTHELLKALGAKLPCGYQAGSPPASEPTAVASLALAGHGEKDAAHSAARWLAKLQSSDGSVGVSQSESKPQWPTSLAILAWQSADELGQPPSIEDSRPLSRYVQGAIDWALNDKGEPAPQKPHIGHDTTLIGWSWAEETHSWLEPTAYFVMALKRTGLGSDTRTQEGLRLVVDRLLPEGGANYGNTVVLGQPLLPQVHATGLAMLALAGEQVDDPRLEKSLAYLERELPHTAATASLSYGVLGLAAHGRRPPEAAAWLDAAFERETVLKPSPHKLALLALACAPRNPLTESLGEVTLTAATGR